MSKAETVFDQTRNRYLNEIFQAQPAQKAQTLGITVQNDRIEIPFFRRRYILTPAGIQDETGAAPIHSISVVLCKYLLLAPPVPPNRPDWVTYKDFRDAAPFVGAFGKNTEQRIQQRFANDRAALESAAEGVGGVLPDQDFPHDLARVFYALPRVPLLLLFNHADADFPAHAAVLFQQQAQDYLDMECLAIVGWILADYLRQAAGDEPLSLT